MISYERSKKILKKAKIKIKDETINSINSLNTMDIKKMKIYKIMWIPCIAIKTILIQIY